MQTQMLKEHASQLLDTGQVECVIGYEVGPRQKTRPVFVYQGDDAEKLVWNKYATYNLTRYLKEKLGEIDGRVAIVLKPCDTKALNVLVGEKKVERSRIYVIGVECDGIFDADSEDRLQPRCIDCDLDKPLVVDYLISGGNGRVAGESFVGDQEEVNLACMEGMSASEKAEFWLAQFDRCLRCYACRQVCPICDCPTCLYERDDSMWVGASFGIMEKRTFHLGRAYHLAGRCIGCNECERVCPVNIPIRLLNQKIANELEKVHGFRPGFDLSPSPIATVISDKE
jgi:Fe-S oxidoreductase